MKKKITLIVIPLLAAACATQPDTAQTTSTEVQIEKPAEVGAGRCPPGIETVGAGRCPPGIEQTNINQTTVLPLAGSSDESE